MPESPSLEPPLPDNVADPGAHQLSEASDSEDSFMDAPSIPGSPKAGSPVNEAQDAKQDDEVPHKEHLSTEADESKEHDAQPDESAAVADHGATTSDPTPQETAPIPITVVEESTGETPRQHTNLQNRAADTSPDILLGPDGQVQGGSKVDEADLSQAPSPDDRLPSENADEHLTETHDDGVDQGFDDGFDDDFDDFEEGDGQNEDFDDFKNDFHQPEAPAAMPAPPVQHNMLPFPIPDFDGLSPDEVITAVDPCLSSIFPPEKLDFPPFPPLAKDYVFLTPRSASLWSQLVAPPPLAPPDWIRSHTRRLFLVSLGVPVDLDEILPASKQKKLILPSLNVSSTSPRSSHDLRVASSTRAKQDAGNASSTSANEPARRRKGPPPEPELDLVAAKHLCHTTDEALDGMTDLELREHVAKLDAMQGIAKQLLEYWTQRTDEKIGDREAFEGVIENLVAHARKVRK